MNERTPEQIAKTEALFRNVNEEIKDAAERFDAETGEFICECGDPGCTEHIRLPLETYDRVRRRPTRFVVRPGHVKGPLERVVKRERNHSIVEKIDALASRIVRRLNPRPETT
jgi:hypothetical protein